MSYVTYTTEALVCGGFDQNTADKSFLLFTKDAGMLFASARSVREESSKQRQALADFSRIRVSLIKGKAGWRVGSVEALANDYSLSTNRLMRGSVVRLYRLLRRFIRGEEPIPEVYDFVLEALSVLNGEITNRPSFDLLIEVRLLSLLGYVATSEIPREIISLPLASAGNLSPEHDVILRQLISKATESSHL